MAAMRITFMALACAAVVMFVTRSGSYDQGNVGSGIGMTNRVSRISRVPTLCRAQPLVLDPKLLGKHTKLPYNAMKDGFGAAIERASRNRDLAAKRELEQARNQVVQMTANGLETGGYEEKRRIMLEKKRQEMMDLCLRRREKENQLIDDLKARGKFSIDTFDQYGLTLDVQDIIEKASKTLANSLREDAGGARLVTMKMEVDPMPWWDNVKEHTMAVRVAQELAVEMDYEKVLFLCENPAVLQGYNTDGLRVGQFGDPNLDREDAEVVVVMKPTIENLDQLKKLTDATVGTIWSDAIIIDGEYGAPSGMEEKKVRQVAKDYFTGGLKAVGFIMDPVKLVPNMGGDPYPLPQWLKDAGYKAAGNIAITGNSGTGKSSLNNALRGLKPRDEGAAAVGVKETTIDPHGYEYPEAGPDMRLWDLPGAGTPKFPLSSYMRNMGIKYFDDIVIASAGRFTETDLELMDELRQHGVSYVALRTKIDLELRNAEEDSGAGEAETLDRIRKDIAKNSLLPEDRIYMISVRRPDDFDFQKLKNYLTDTMKRAVDVKLAKALNRKLEIREIWNAVAN